jgi:murein DD-endopeptidase MepM/ murein hydrolase activator NlpD
MPNASGRDVRPHREVVGDLAGPAEGELIIGTRTKGRSGSATSVPVTSVDTFDEGIATHPGGHRGPGATDARPLPITRVGLATARRAMLDQVIHRFRAAVRFVRFDTPTLWRMAAHAAVLVLTLGVFVVARFGGADPVVASTRVEGLGNLAERLGGRALDVLPEPVLGTEASTVPARQVAASGPGFLSTGLVPEADQTLLPWEEPQRYIVQDGDTITGIAQQFGIEAETVLYANPSLRENPHNLSIGQEVTILPINGVLHVVKDGDTIQSIAESYKAKPEDIVAYAPNGLAADAALVAGTEVVVPGGQMDIVIPSFYEMGHGVGAREVWVSDGGGGPAAGTGSFYAASYGRITTRFSRWHAAVDIANRTGTPIYAVDSGTVEVAGWYGWAGQAVIIDHGNGFESLYAHMNSIDVSAGQGVQRGQIIGGIGCTRGRGGRCTGPHLHLELYFQGRRVNPCTYGACP